MATKMGRKQSLQKNLGKVNMYNNWKFADVEPGGGGNRKKNKSRLNHVLTAGVCRKVKTWNRRVGKNSRQRKGEWIFVKKVKEDCRKVGKAKPMRKKRKRLPSEIKEIECLCHS